MYMEHPQLLESAAVAYLVGLATNNPTYWDDLLEDAAGNLRINAGESSSEKDGQNIVAYISGDMGEEDPPCSGNRWADLIIALHTPSVKRTSDAQLASHQANADALQSALLAPTLPDLLTAAQAGLTVFGIKDRMPFREQDGLGWTSGWKIGLYSCPATFPN
jgi:hypothetical protein